jgi:hypothetical protein
MPAHSDKKTKGMSPHPYFDERYPEHPEGRLRQSMSALLTSFGLPPEKWDDYLVEVGGMIDMAFDDYFASLKEGREPHLSVVLTDLNSSGDTSG